MSRYPPGCESLIGGHLLLLDSSGGLRRRGGDVHRRRHRVGPRAHVSVLLIQRLAEVLGAPYDSPANGTPTAAAAAGTQVRRMPVRNVGMTRMGRRTHHLALPIKARKIPVVTPCLGSLQCLFEALPGYRRFVDFSPGFFL